MQQKIKEALLNNPKVIEAAETHLPNVAMFAVALATILKITAPESLILAAQFREQFKLQNSK